MAKYGPFSTELLINNSLKPEISHCSSKYQDTHFPRPLSTCECQYLCTQISALCCFFSSNIMQIFEYISIDIHKLIEVGESLSHSVTQSLR